MRRRTAGQARQGDGRDQGLIAVGRLTRPVGLKGEMALELLTDRRERIQNIEQAWVGATAPEASLHQMQQVRLTPKAVVVKLSDVDSRTEAEHYRGQYVFVEAGNSPGPEPGSFYVHEVVGLDVVDEDGAYIGTIADVRNLPGQDLWVVMRGGREVLIPAVSEFIRSVQMDQHRVVVRLIEGLIDEN